MECTTVKVTAVKAKLVRYYFKTGSNGVQYGVGSYAFRKDTSKETVIAKIREAHRNVIEISEGRGILSRILWSSDATNY